MNRLRSPHRRLRWTKPDWSALNLSHLNRAAQFSTTMRVALLWLIICGLFVSGPLIACAQDNFQIDQGTIEAWIFQRHGSRVMAMKSLDAEVHLRINSAKKQYGLDPEQISQLELAASGDIKRFMDQANIVIQDVAGTTVDQNGFNDAWQRTQPLQQKMQRGLIGDDSLFHKVLMEMLSPQQSEMMQQSIKEANKRRIRAHVRSMVANIQQALPMTHAQYTRLSELVEQRLEGATLDSDYTYYVIMAGFVKIPRDTLAEIFDEQQMQAADQLRKTAEDFLPFLEQNGFVANAVLIEQALPAIEIEEAIEVEEAADE